MIFASAATLRRLVAALQCLGLNCVLPVGGECSRRQFILTTLLKLQYLIEPPQFSSQGEGGEAQAELSQRGDMGEPSDPTEQAAFSAVREAETPPKQLILLHHLAAFILQRVGVDLDLQVLFRAEADAISELLRLAESLADGVRQALNSQATCREGEEEGGEIKREKPFEVPQTLWVRDNACGLVRPPVHDPVPLHVGACSPSTFSCKV